MKTKLFFTSCFALFLLAFSSNLYSQSLYETPSDLSTFDSSFDLNDSYTFANTKESFNFSEVASSVDETLGLEEVHDPEDLIRFASKMFALGAGLGFGNDQTLWCLHAAYYLRLATMGNSFFYGALGLGVSGLSSDFFTRTLLEPTLRFLMFSPITQFSQVYFLYGLALAYAFGSEDFDSGGKYDITRFTAALVVGFAIILSTKLTLMLQTNLVAHTRQTAEPDGGGVKTETNNTLGTINQNNLVFFTLLFNL